MSLQQALTLLSESHCPVVAGGTDFYPSLQDQAPPLDVIDITQFNELKQVEQVDGHWRIGAGVTWSQVVKSDLPPAFDALKAGALEVGSIQIQNRATIVGNVCNASPAADGMPALLALDAQVECQSLSGTRIIALSEFVKGVRHTDREANELVTALLIPERANTERSAFKKLGARRYLVISAAMVAVNVDSDVHGIVQRCAIAVGSCSPVATRLSGLEQMLVGMAANDTAGFMEAVSQHDYQELAPIDDVRGSKAYRYSVVKTLVGRTLNHACSQLIQPGNA